MRRARFLVLSLALCVTIGCDTDSPTEPGTSRSITIDTPEDRFCIQPGQSVNFTATYTGPPGTPSFSWTIDGAEFSTDEDPAPQTFPEKGIYNIRVRAGGDQGVDASIQILVRDNCVPMEISIDSPEDGQEVFDGEPVNFQGTIVGGDTPYSIVWSFGDAGIPNLTVEDPGPRTFTEGPREYIVTFSVTDAIGDFRTTLHTVEVVSPSAEFAVGPINIDHDSGPGQDLDTGLDGIFLIPGGQWAGFNADYVLGVSHSSGVTIFDPLNQEVLDAEFRADGNPRLGAVPLSLPDGSKAVGDALFRFGPGSKLVTYGPEGWEAFEQNVESFTTVFDGVAYDNNLVASGLVVTSGFRVSFYEAQSGVYLFQSEVVQNVISPDLSGLVSAFGREASPSYLVLSSGSPGRVYQHDRTEDPGTLVGFVENDARKIRCLDEVCAVSNFGSDSITLLTWDAQDVATIVGSFPVGDGPVGIDIKRLGNGNLGVLTTGFNDGTISVTEVTSAGVFVCTVTTQLPATDCDQPGHAVWANDPNDRVIVSCFGSDTLYVSESGLQAPGVKAAGNRRPGPR